MARRIKRLKYRQAAIRASLLVISAFAFCQPNQARAQQVDNNNFNWAAQSNADPSVQGSLRFTTTHSGTGNLYTYHRITPTGLGYVVASGDYLEYDVYCSPNNPSGVCDAAVEIDFTDTSLRGFGPVDQNGIGNQMGDISAYARGRWYHRKISLSAAVGKTINNVDMIEESDLNGTYTNYYRRIFITNGSTVKSTVWESGAPGANTIAYGNGSSGNDASGSYYRELYSAGPGSNYFAGKVGIGTTAPTAKLDIRGSSTANSYAVNDGQEDLRVLSSNNRVYDGGVITIGGLWGPTGYIKTNATEGTAGDLVIGNRRNATDTSMQPGIVLNTSGNFGIGTTQPSAKLHVAGTTNLWGNVGIGTTSSNANLDVQGNITATGNGTTSGVISGTNVIAKYQDVAEWVPASRAIPTGTVC